MARLDDIFPYPAVEGQTAVGTSATILINGVEVVLDFGRHDAKQLFLKLYQNFGQTVSSNELFRVAKGSTHMNRVGVLVGIINKVISSYDLSVINEYAAGYRLARGTENEVILKRQTRILTLPNGEELEIVCSEKVLQTLQVLAENTDGITLQEIVDRTYIKTIADIEKVISKFRSYLKPHGYYISLIQVEGVRKYVVTRISTEL